MVSAVDSLSDAANTVNSVTMPTPTMSADAVAAVRRGLRMAFCLASVPVRPRSLASGAPRSPATGRATTGPSTTVPSSVMTAPSPTIPSEGSLDRAVAAVRAMPTPARIAPATTRGAEGEVRSTATSRSAARGGTRDVLIAGMIPASSVTTRPTTTDTRMAPPVTTRPPAGRANPAASNSPLSSPATAMPPASPTSDATTPTTRASITTETSTWRREAPMARSRAAVRVRWATMIEKVL
jgi:hypothetical protein